MRINTYDDDYGEASPKLNIQNCTDDIVYESSPIV